VAKVRIAEAENSGWKSGWDCDMIKKRYSKFTSIIIGGKIDDLSGRFFKKTQQPGV
jgi:hypothetical protein